MLVRRALFYWQFAAVVVLPLWLLIGWAAWGSAGLSVLLAVPFLVLAMLVVMGLTFARKSVRESRSVSWIDAAVLTVWHLAIVGAGFYGGGANWFAALIVLTTMVAFWLALWQLVAETRRRVRRVLASFEQLVGPAVPRREPLSAGEYIVLDQRPRA